MQNIFIGLCKWKKFSLIFWFMFPLFVTEFWNKEVFSFQWEKVLDLEGTLKIDHVVKRLYFTTEKTQDSKKFSDLPKDIHWLLAKWEWEFRVPN